MQNRAHVRARLCALTQTHADRARRARTTALPAGPIGRDQLIARWVWSAHGGGLELRWEPRVQPRTLITRSRGAVRLTSHCS